MTSAALALAIALGPPDGPWCVQVYAVGEHRSVDGIHRRSVWGALTTHPNVIAREPGDAATFGWHILAKAAALEASRRLTARGWHASTYTSRPEHLTRGTDTTTVTRTPRDL